MTAVSADVAIAGPGRGTRGAWRVVATEELRELWFSAKGLGVLFGYTVLLSVLSYLAASEAGVNLLDARESVGVVVQVAIGLGTLTALIVSADAISGERERGTLEALLLTPTRRRDLVVGKLLAATTMWVAALLVALPYVAVLSLRGPGVMAEAVVLLIVVGSLVAAAVTALGLAISALAMSNRISLAASVAILLVLAAPSQLPGIKPDSTMGSILIKANPVSAGLKLTNEILINQRSWSSQWTLLISPVIATVALTAIAVALSRRLELGGAR